MSQTMLHDRAGRTPADRQLLAKSNTPGRPPCTLAGHTADVITAFEALFGTQDVPTSLCDAWLEFFKLDRAMRGSFLSHGKTAAACHDWGKANDGFQRMLARRGRQLIRHEHLSAVLINYASVWNWLASGGLDVPLLLAAVAGHHLKASDADFGRAEAEIDQPLVLRWGDAELRAGLVRLGRESGLTRPVPDDVPRVWTLDGTPGVADLAEALASARDRLDEFDRALRSDDHLVRSRRRLLWAVRAGLIAADAAGSGLIRTGEDVAAWIDKSFFRPLSDADTPDGRMTAATIDLKVIAPRLEDIGITAEQLNPFQRACGDASLVPERALLLAPCGSGKTLAAWRWIEARCAKKPRRRAIFLYPTRGTATEGYRDYVAGAGPEMAALVHGTADLDLDGMHADVPDEDRINAARLFALRQWPKRLISATVDQFLGFLQHGYGPTCHLPLLADSVVVLDEVHSYDRGMFSALLEFLGHFDVPVLCMTATMLEGRRHKLEAAGLKYVNGLDFAGDASTGLDSGGGDGASELRKAADFGRYRVRRVADSASAEEIVRQALDAGRRVLWVVNTVNRCQALARAFAADPTADRLETEGAVPLFCYHGRFRLKDRKTRHEAVIGAFKSARQGETKRPVLAVTTQVCEMSLDLDADVLVTEFCPATALVQRMGRCCRDARAHVDGRTPGEVIVYEPPGDDARTRRLPYTTQDMNGVDGLVDRLTAADTVSQTALEALLLTVPAPAELPKACRFIESGAWAAAGEENFRDANDLGRPAVLAEDVDEYARLRDPKRRGDDPPWLADGLVMNVPKKFVQPHGRYDLPAWLHMARGGIYHAALGFCGGEPTGPLFG